MPIIAIEFFSGIGGFAYAARSQGIHIAAAFDQDERANLVYCLNFSTNPSPTNLDSIDARNIPPADLWWMSPPCQPYTIRGTRKDEQDARSQSLKRLISVLAVRQPRLILLENVLGFAGSRMHRLFLDATTKLGYQHQELAFCSSDLNVPMKRPRLFLICIKTNHAAPLLRISQDLPSYAVTAPVRSLHYYLDEDPDPRLFVNREFISRYGKSLNIVDPVKNDATCICFTSGYGVSRKASGSLLETTKGTRYFSAREILRLLGFADDFKLPDGLTLKQSWRLVGNSLDVRAVTLLLQAVVDQPGLN